MFTVIKASEKDFPIIRDIACKTWPHTFKDILSVKQIEYMLEMMYSIDSITRQVKEKYHEFYLAKYKDEIAGYISCEINYQNTDKIKIHKIYILPSMQGKGIGKLLMDKVTEIARLNNNRILSLNVNRDNKAINFYEKYGFVKVGKEDIDIGNGFLMEDFIMEKSV